MTRSGLLQWKEGEVLKVVLALDLDSSGPGGERTGSLV